MRFRATLNSNGKTATGFTVPEEIVEGLGSKRPKVKVTINGYTYRSSVASMGGRYLLGVNADVREAAGVAAGDVLDVDIELDTEPREVEVPADFAKALDAKPKAREFFDSMSFTHKSWHVIRVEGAKKAETRERRIAESVEMLAEGRTGTR
jgi:hypothetical protein